MADRVLIADIGGSSSRWAWADAQGHARPVTLGMEPVPGFNPATGDGSALLQRLKEADAELASAQRVHVYGAGCGSPQRQEAMATVLKAIWPAERIHVESDLLGAARGMLDREPGAVLILGTGMNAGLYDGTMLALQFPSLGPLLGDEGSGADIGRHLWRDALYGTMPDRVRVHLFGTDGPDRDVLLREAYRGAAPGRFLAAPVAHLHGVIDDPYVVALLAARFSALARLLAHRYPEVPGNGWHAVGSVAWGFRPLLQAAVEAVGQRLKAVERDPLQGLARHHR